MKKEIIQSLAKNFEDYTNTTKVIQKAKTSCEASNSSISDHFVEFNKMVITSLFCLIFKSAD